MSAKKIVLEMNHITFCYPTAEKPVLQDISLQISTSEMIVLCGQSGCGKSTLLRHMKKNQIPFGSGSGEILFDGKSLEQMDDREAAYRIGFVGQEPESQIVTDTVWHELAFGLENMAVSAGEIRRRTAEMAEYLGIAGLFRRRVDELSGGQKQLLNLASVMVMKPDFLILDEPTAQMDPIAAKRFIQTLVRLNRDFGTTMILSEQRLEEVLPLADRVMIMHDGRILAEGEAAKSGWLLRQCEKKLQASLPVQDAFPTVLRVYTACESALTEESICPLSVKAGREWLQEKVDDISENFRAGQKVHKSRNFRASHGKNVVLSAKNVAFSYEKGKRILDDFTLEVEAGSFFGILGGNGSGKTTALKLLSGIYKKWECGKIKRQGRVLYLAQNPQSLFTEVTVEDELAEMFSADTLTMEEKKREVAHMLEFLEMTRLAGQNPMDLSGGEKQRLALGKILLRKPDVLLLDEPTKGLDAAFKNKLSELLFALRKKGMTIVMVSHDLEFCARNVTACGLLFDGSIISSAETREFFEGNSFYTTAAARMSVGILAGCILEEDIVEKIKGAQENAGKPKNI
jgi:energy-coupling factor transport system ATP-binding protein